MSVQDLKRTYHVHKRGTLFGSAAVQAVRGVSFDVKRGESLGIVGESGCGKSTLLRLLTWLEFPDSGSIQFGGADIKHLNSQQRFDLRSQLQLVLQDPYESIPAHWTIGRTISEAVRLHQSMDSSARRQLVLDSMQEVGLDASLFDKLPAGLSAGQRQRINLARALVLKPSLLLLDETLSALDQGEQSRMIKLFEELQARRGITYIFISHDLAMVRRVCSRVAVMYLGRMVEMGDNDSIFSAPQHPYTRALLAAAPTLEDSPYSQQNCLVDGEPPSPIRLPAGCAFANRCPMAQALCREQDPPARTADSGTVVCCHFSQTLTPLTPGLASEPALEEG
jgi:peptide/nickel transport system ATP-binding protein